MKKQMVRMSAAITAVLLVLGYWLLPVREDRSILSGSGHKKWELHPGENVYWTWKPALDDCTELLVYLKGLKKGQDITLTAELKDPSGQIAGQVIQCLAELGDRDYLTLQGRFQKNKEYILEIRAAGDGTISIKG